MRVRIEPSVAYGKVVVPPSKSYAHRLLIAASLSDKESIVSNVALSNDIIATINCLKTLGKNIEILDDVNGNNKIIKINTIVNFEDLDSELVFDCLESGSSLRFFIPIALLTGKTVKFIGTEKLISRGILPYEEICLKQNIKVIKEKTSITFIGKLSSDEFIIPGNISSQFISGLLFALPLLAGNSSIKITNTLESKNYIDITLDVLKQAGIKIDEQEKIYNICGNQQYQPNNYFVEGDYSNAAFLDAFNYFGGNVELIGLNPDSYQGDKVYKKYFELLSDDFQILDLSNCIDLGPIMFGFAAMKHGAKFIGTKRLKIKESDRILAVDAEIDKFQAKLSEFDDFVVIDKQILSKPKKLLNGQNDHRIVMMLSVMASVYGGTIDGVEAVNKSYPAFFKDLERLGIEVHYNVDE
ncbi:MAG: 3-phosphoshikimate 1-carboxyvinyltransferase [Bacilli bacterium]|nr:3-phosphoshikimate 1-carboxyvinyltransferase [Bacilli bacterium]